MNDNRQMPIDDALLMVNLRNQFYKEKYHYALGMYFLTLAIIAILVGVIVYLLKAPVHPYYFVTDELSRLIDDIPVQRPNMTTDAVTAWTIDAVESAYSYDVINYRAELQSAQKYFSEYGWTRYMDSLKASNNLIALTERKLIVIAKVVQKPKLVTEGLLGGAYAWKYEMPVLVTYLYPPYDDKSKFINALSVSVIVQRQPILRSYKGLGIVQMIATLVITPTQNLAAPPS